jgi:KDO2-lipid IV(A) lauroyltransferase
MRVLYVLSDVVYFFIYHVFGYRKELVVDNLTHAFPEKSKEEINTICRAFYKNFCDRRFTGNWEVLEQLRVEGKNAYVFLGHTFNWEWANVASQFNIKQQMAGVYLPLENAAFDKLVLKLRKRANGMMVSMKAKKEAFAELNKLQHALGLIADQNPSNLNNVLWVNFMGREAPFFIGSAHMAKKGNAAIVLSQIKKLNRGHYQLIMQRLCDDASTMEAEAIVHAYVKHLEQQIRQQPENWMWTHRRWKHNPATAQ